MDEHFTAVPPGASYESVLRKCLTGTSNYLYVVDDDNRLEGVISFSDLKEFVFEEELKDLVLARDLANQNLVCVTPDESLASSLNKFSFIDMEQLPVVDRLDGKIEMKGVITRNQLLRAYRQEMLKRVVFRTSGSHGSPCIDSTPLSLLSFLDRYPRRPRAETVSAP